MTHLNTEGLVLLRQPPGEEFVELPDLLPVVAVTAVYVILPDPGGGAADGEGHVLGDPGRVVL